MTKREGEGQVRWQQRLLPMQGRVTTSYLIDKSSKNICAPITMADCMQNPEGRSLGKNEGQSGRNAPKEGRHTSFDRVSVVTPPVGHRGSLHRAERNEQEQHVKVVSCVGCCTGQIRKLLPELITV